MRSKFIVPGLGLILMAAMCVWVGGCSDDSNPAADKILPGAADDPQFLFVQDHIDNYLDTANVYFETAFDNMYLVPGGSGEEYPLPDPETEDPDIPMYGPMDDGALFEYTYADGWHVRYIYRENSVFTDHFRDSTQFMAVSEVVEDAESADYMNFILHWDYTDNETDATHYNWAGYMNFEFSDLDATTATISGTDASRIEWNYISVDTTIEAVVDMAVTVTDLAVYQSAGEVWDCGCPTDGTVEMDVNVSYTLDDGVFPQMTATAWDVTVEITDGAAEVRVVNGKEYWEYTVDMCTVTSE